VQFMYIEKSSRDCDSIGGQYYKICKRIRHYIEEKRFGNVVKNTEDYLEIECKLGELFDLLKRLAHRYIDWNQFEVLHELLHFLEEVRTNIFVGEYNADELVKFYIFCE